MSFSACANKEIAANHLVRGRWESWNKVPAVALNWILQ